MGNERSSENLSSPDNSNRVIFISFDTFRKWPAESYNSRFDSFTFIVKYQRYFWVISKRFSDIVSLDSRLLSQFPEKIDRIKCPRKYRKLFWNHTDELLTRRANDIVAYLQTILDDREIFESDVMREFLGIGQTSLRPQLGRKGKEGYLQKCSGGYLENYSSRPGDFIKTWQKRWFVLHDNYIAYYKTSKDFIPQGCIQIDQKFQVTITGRVVTVSNRSRKLTVVASTMKEAVEWAEALNQFYQYTPKRLTQPFYAHFPPRPSSGVKLFCCGKEYFSALAVALLRAQEEILIASWMVSPTLLLTRPPLPPLRLDQILRFKAEQGVKIYVLLYKEVEMSGTGNDSFKCRLYLESLHPTNICTLRHPNKLLGGSTAILWSHHEKLVIVDRKIGFIGGIDPCFGRWDDDRHILTDEDGILFPGKDYYQPARGLFRPVQDFETLSQQDIEDDIGQFVNEGNDDEQNWNDDNRSEVDGYCPSEIQDDEPLEGSPESTSSWIGEENARKSRKGLLPVIGKSRQISQKRGFTSEELKAIGQDDPTPIDLSVFDEVEEVDPPAKPENQTPIKSDNQTPQPPLRFTVTATREPAPAPKHFTVVGTIVQPPPPQTANCMMVAPSYPEAPPLTLTAETLQANSIQYEDTENLSSAPKGSDLQSTASSTLYAIKSTESRSREYSLALPFRSLVESFQSLSEGVTEKLEQIRSEKKKVDEINVRDFYPRMPWHDVHGCITGLPVRDLSSHFVQRWNHHRVSKSVHDSHPVLTDLTDNLHFSVCAKCNLTNIFETATTCPNCHYDLGPNYLPLSHNLTELSPLKSPQEHVSSYLTYDCYFSSQLGCRIQGDGPSLVTLILNPDTVKKIVSGKIIENIGQDDHIQFMIQQGIRPMLGDVLVSIEDVTVLHLNSMEVQRLIKRLRSKLKRTSQRDLLENSEAMSVSSIFRRHYVNNVEDIMKHDHKVELYVQEQSLKYEKAQELDSSRRASSKLTDQEICPISPSEEEEKKENLEDPDLKPILQQSSSFGQFLSSKMNEEKWDYTAARIDLVCRACTSREVCKAMVDAEKQIQSRGDVLPNIGSLSGTCQVQVLRSVGPWSVGQSPETSIHNAWVQTIQQAQHFIYIENQFFIGDLAGVDVKNSIARALLDRVVLAAQRKESFKAIIIVPVHPEGDYVSTSGPLGVMNYQYKTISRGGTSFLEQFQKHTRGQINPLDYVCFCSLRNWGQLNGKLVLDQIYVHDKLLIVDDRVMIMGSANVNDRSMLGERDTEMAIRIEDTTHYMGKMGGNPWVVGAVPHMFRKRLMAKHIGDYRCDLTDPICDEVYRQKWLLIARENTGLYNELDGPCSYDKCNTLAEYAQAIAERPYLNANDPLVESFLVRIKGHLVMFPLRFLLKENLKSLAHSTVLPDELFA